MIKYIKTWFDNLHNKLFRPRAHQVYENTIMQLQLKQLKL